MTLALLDEPFVLADGTKINPTNGKVVKEQQTAPKFVEIPNARVSQEIVARTRRSIAELPFEPKNMNAVSLCLLYTMWGLADSDIGVATGMSIDQIKNIKKLPQYKTISDDIVSSILEHEATDIRGFFKQSARGAAAKIVAIADEDDGVLGFKASQDVLDRAGFRPADVVEHRHSMLDALRIEYVQRTPDTQLAIIDATFEDITDGNRP